MSVENIKKHKFFKQNSKIKTKYLFVALILILNKIQIK